MLGRSSDNPFLKQNSSKSRKDVVTDFLQTVVLALAFSLILYLVFLVPSIVDGPSMEPSYYDNELLFANQTIQWIGATSFGKDRGYDYQRGDVIIFKHQDTNLIKRIVAAEGDTVKLSNGNVYVNDRLLEEHYLPASTKSYSPGGNRALIDENESITVTDGTYFVMGDNRSVSKDSRFSEVGLVDRSQIRGKVFLRYWPISRFGFIGTGDYSETEFL